MFLNILKMFLVVVFTTVLSGCAVITGGMAYGIVVLTRDWRNGTVRAKGGLNFLSFTREVLLCLRDSKKCFCASSSFHSFRAV